MGAQNSQGSVPGEWEGWGLGINLVLNFLGSELPGSEPSGRRGPCQSAVTVYHGHPPPTPGGVAGRVSAWRLRLVQLELLPRDGGWEGGGDSRSCVAWERWIGPWETPDLQETWLLLDFYPTWGRESEVLHQRLWCQGSPGG